MWAGHYIIGLTFYLLIGPAVFLAEAMPTIYLIARQQDGEEYWQETRDRSMVWTDETASATVNPNLLATTMLPTNITILATQILSRPVASAARALATIRLRTAILLPLFILASALQHDAHMHLASLKDKAAECVVDEGDESEEGKECKEGKEPIQTNTAGSSSLTNTNSNKENANDESDNNKTTYSLPTHPLFSRLIAPHYTLEIAIYIIIALLVAPDKLQFTRGSPADPLGYDDDNNNENTSISSMTNYASSSSSAAAATTAASSALSSSPAAGAAAAAIKSVVTTTTLPVNYTVAAAALFVAVNLGVTAAGTRRWYATRFGPDAARAKWTLVPLVW